MKPIRRAGAAGAYVRARSLTVALSVTAALTAATACGADRDAAADAKARYNHGRLSIVTGNTTGVYYQLGGAYAEVINRNLPGYRATAEATNASVENIHRLVLGQADIAFSLSDAAGAAATGGGTFLGEQRIRALARLYNNYTHVVVRTDARIRSIADMRGKRISTGSPYSGTETIALRLLMAAGLNPQIDVKKQELSLNETIQGMKDGTLDGLFWSGGAPASGITDLTTSLRNKVTFLPVDSLLTTMRNYYGEAYEPATLSRNAYKLAYDVPTIAVPNVLIVSDKMPKALARDLTRLIFSHQADLAMAHPEGGNISREKAPRCEPVVLHPGARSYYFDG